MENYTRDLQSKSEDLKTLTFSICTNNPYTRNSEKYGEYDEILTISNDAIDWSRLSSGHCAFLKDHDQRFVLGVITKAWVEGNEVKVNVKFSERAEKYVKDIEDGIMTCTSIGYNIDEFHWENINGRKSMIVDRYMIYEASLVRSPCRYFLRVQQKFGYEYGRRKQEKL